MKKFLSLILALLLCSPVFAAQELIIIDEFKGMQRNTEADKIEDNSHYVFKDVYVKDGSIQVVKGRTKLNTTAVADKTVNGIYYYQKGTTQKLFVKESDEVVTYNPTTGGSRTSLVGSLHDSSVDYTMIGTTLYVSNGTDGLYKSTLGTALTAVGDADSSPSTPAGGIASGDGGLTPGQAAVVVPINQTHTGDPYYYDAATTSCLRGQQDLVGYTEVNHEENTTACGSLNATYFAKDCATTVTYRYKITHYNNRWGIESVASGGRNVSLTGADTVSVALKDPTVYFTTSSCTSSSERYGGYEVVVGSSSTRAYLTLVATTAPYNTHRIYRSAAGSYDLFLVGEQNSGTFYDGKPDIALGTPLDTTIQILATPHRPLNATYKGVLFQAKIGNEINFTHLPVNADTDMDTYWLGTDEISLSSEKVITAMVPTKNSLLVFTANSIDEITGFGASSFRVNKITTTVGAISKEAIEVDSNGDIIFFAGTKGVYKFNIGGQLTDSLQGAVIDRTDTTFQKISSPNLDQVFLENDSTIALDASDYINAHAYYDLDKDLYFLYIGNDCLMYDNVNTAWTHIPNSKFVASEYIDYVRDVGYGYLIDDLGFHWKNWTGYENGAASGTVTGIATASTSDTLTDSTATFNTTGDGLAGVWVTVDSLVPESRRIVSNTATELTVESNWSTAPSIYDTYYIGYINPTIETKQLNVSKPPQKTRVLATYLNHEKSDSSQNLEFLTYNDKSTTPTSEDTVDLADNYIDKILMRSHLGYWTQWEMFSWVYNTSDTISPPVRINAYGFKAEVVKEK